MTTGAAGRGPEGRSDFTSLIEQNTIRRLTLRLIPFLMLCYVVAWLNRYNLSFASLTMNKDIGLTSSMYGLGAGLFFVTYCLCEVPSNILLYRFGARRWIARIMLSWGLVAMAMAYVQGPTSFYAMRLLLGAAEAGFYPGVLYFLTMWFPHAHRGRALGLFLAAIPITGVVGAPLSAALLSLDGIAGLKGWQWMYLVEGLPAVLLAPAVLFMIKDSPAEAQWLPEQEKIWLNQRLAAERRSIDATEPGSLLSVLRDGRVLLMALTYFTNACLINGITFFLPQIVRGFGLTVMQTGLVVAIPSALALVALIWWGRRSDARRERFGHAAVANLVGGLCLLAATQIQSPVFKMAAIAVSFAATLAFTAPFWAIPGTFLTAGRAATGIATISALGVAGGFVAPFVIGWLRDLTGAFTIGLAIDAALSIVVSSLFYLLMGRSRGSQATG